MEGGGRCDRVAVARVFLCSDKIIRFRLFLATFCLLFVFNGSVSDSGLPFKGSTQHEVDKSCEISVFLYVEIKNRRCQLTPVLTRWKGRSRFRNKAKSIFSCQKVMNRWSFLLCKFAYCFGLLVNVAINVGYLYLKFLSLTITRPTRRTDLSSHKNYRSMKSTLCRQTKHCFVIGIGILLLRAGIEPNPGPDLATNFPEFSVISQNCRGLTNCKKVCRMVKKLNLSKAPLTVACLQETHCINKFALNNLYKGTYVVDDGDRNQRGVSILIPEGLELCESRTSGLGRWAIAAIKPTSSVQSYKTLVASVYAPNCHRESKIFFEDFFHNLDSIMEDLAVESCEFNTILTGDFNLVLNSATGALNRAGTSGERNLATFVKDALATRSLLEIQTHDSRNNGFTWRRGNCFSKLDYIFASPLLHAQAKNTLIKWYEFGSNYDHACIKASFVASSTPARGRSFPKLFKTDISNEADRLWIVNQLDNFSQQISPHWNPHMKLEFVKTMLRVKVLELRKMNKFTSSSDVIKERIDGIVAKPILSRADIQQVEALRIKLARAEEVEEETMSIRAGIKWREEGERSSKFFLSRFKARAAATTMHILHVGQQVISQSTGLVNFVRIFYSNLYNSVLPEKVNDDQFLREFFSHCPKMGRELQISLARPLDLEELKISLTSCKDSAPGLDGIPYSFYKLLPDLMLPLLLNSWNYALRSGELAKSHRQSCLTLLPKKGKDLTRLGNWRPISLSSCDLKIITKAYANRLKNTLPHILCESQAAYIPGRDISFNNRLLNLAKLYASKQGEDVCVVSLDAKKAFDSVSHDYLINVLKAYDFPPEFIQVFRTLYTNLESVVQVNGFLSSPFRVKNGVKQGDALSCGLFVLAMDPLIRNILMNDSIEGLIVPTSQHDIEEIKVLAYADDITIVCRNGNLQPVFSEYERLSYVSGLKLNADKTEILNLIPSQSNSNRITYLGLVFLLGRVDRMTVCGMVIAGDAIAEYQGNVLDRIEKMESIVASWSRRNITMHGRMVLAKTFVISQIVFPAQFIQIGAKEIRKIERLIYAFVNGARTLYGPEKIARRYLKADKLKGGINGIDVNSFVTAIALRQFGKAAQLSRQLRAFQASVNAPRDDIGNMAMSHLKSGILQFLKNHPMPDLTELEYISSTHLSVFLKNNSNAAIHVNQYSIGSLFELQRELERGRIPRPRLNSIIRSLPQQLGRLIRAGSLVNAQTKFSLATLTDKLDLEFTTSKSIRLALASQKLGTLSIDLNKIHRRQDLPVAGTVEFDQLFSNMNLIKHPALRSIRYKLCFKNIYSNERRHRFGIADSPVCESPNCDQIETVEHQLFECANANRLWNMFAALTNLNITSYRDLILCGSEIEHEILKTAIIKALIQINRNISVPVKVVARECASLLRIEAIVNRAREQAIRSLITKLNSVD